MIATLKVIVLGPLFTLADLVLPLGSYRIRVLKNLEEGMGACALNRMKRRPTLLYQWLAGAARRQAWQNELNLPGYLELQRRKYQRWHCWKTVLKYVALQQSVMYALGCTVPIIQAKAPGLYHLLDVAAVAFTQALEAGGDRVFQLFGP